MPNDILEFSATPSAEREETDVTDPERLQQRPTTGNGNIDVLLASHAISGSRSLSQSFA